MSPIVASGSLIIQMRICNYSKNMPWVYITYHEVVLNSGSYLRDDEGTCYHWGSQRQGTGVW